MNVNLKKSPSFYARKRHAPLMKRQECRAASSIFHRWEVFSRGLLTRTIVFPRRGS